MKLKYILIFFMAIAIIFVIAEHNKIRYAHNVIKARKYYVKGDIPKAEEAYRKAIQIAPDKFEQYQELAYLYKENKQKEDLDKIYIEGLKVNPNDEHFLRECIAIYLKNHDYQNAVELLQRAIEKDQKSGELFFILGRVYMDLGNFKDALIALKVAEERNYAPLRVAYNIACAYEYGSNDYKNALIYYQKCLEIDPSDKYKIKDKMINYSLWSTGQALEDEGQYPEAIEEYQKQLEKMPDNDALISRLGRALRKNCNFPQSESLYVKVLNKKKDDYVILNNLGSLYYDIQRYKDAESCWSDAIKSDPARPNAYYNMGALFAKTGKYDASEKAYMEAMKRGYNESMVWLQLYELYNTYKKDPKKADEFKIKYIESSKIAQKETGKPTN